MFDRTGRCTAGATPVQFAWQPPTLRVRASVSAAIGQVAGRRAVGGADPGQRDHAVQGTACDERARALHHGRIRQVGRRNHHRHAAPRAPCL
jgi:hypothetical protein